MPYLHLPYQAGSDRILAAMNRKHTAEEYERLIERIRAARPDIALSTDIIVGFPGETDADFQATLDAGQACRLRPSLLVQVQRTAGHARRRAGRASPEAVKKERLAILQAQLDESRRSFDRATVGRRIPVLFEGKGRKPDQIAGRSPYLQAVLRGRTGNVDRSHRRG